MTAITSRLDFAPCTAAPAHRAGILRRFYDALMQSRQRQAERDVARLLTASGGRLTDDIERRMTERLIRGGYFPS